MLTLALVAQKGGTGKSTIAVHLAVCAARKKKIVRLIDLDPQRSALGWGVRRRDYGEGVEMDLIALEGRAQELLRLLADARAQGADLVILDTAGRADVTAAQAIAAADAVLIPCRPFAYDLEASVETATEVKRGQSLRAAFVLNAVPSRGTRAAEAREALSKFLPVCPVELHQAVAYGDALADGRSVEELQPHGRAAEEIRSLYRWIMRWEVRRG